MTLCLIGGAFEVVRYKLALLAILVVVLVGVGVLERATGANRAAAGQHA